MRITISQYKTKSGTIGIELKFSKKPTEEILERLRNEGFSWHRIKKVWYTVETPESISFAEALKRELENEPETTNAVSVNPIPPLSKTDNPVEREDEKHAIGDYSQPVEEGEAAAKVPVQVIELTTAFREANPEIDRSETFHSWKAANDFVASLIGKHSNVYYKILWKDGQVINGAMDLEPASFYEGKTDLLGDHIKRFYTNVSKVVNNVIFDEKTVAFTKKILNGYLLEDISDTTTNKEESNGSETEQYQREENTSNAPRSLTGQTPISDEKIELQSKTIIKDIVSRDNEIPNVIIPVGIREPLASQNFYHKDMLAIVEEKFSDLSAINKENIAQANAKTLYELAQLDHPNEYPPITISRYDVLREWENRGEELFKELGLPTDRSYPYVNIHAGYTSVYSLGAVISENDDHEKWWSAAGDHRPIGDLNKAIIYIDDAISELNQKRAALINPKTQKPKAKFLDQARDIDFEINRYERSKEVIEGFLSGSSQEQMQKVPEDIRPALWNQTDNDYPINKITIKGIEFHQALLREALALKIKSLSVDEAIELAGELSLKYKERRPYESYAKGLVTIGKKGDKREIEIVWSYIDDIIIDHDLHQQNGRQGAMEFLLERLYPAYFSTTKSESSGEIQSAPQNQHELNQSIERFIDEKDKEGDGYSENDKNHILQYTGSGGLIRQGASGEGILYEFYTPDEIVQRMWGLADLYGFTGGNILEPACGTGRFLKYVPVESHAIGFEVNHYAKRIAEILYPWAEVIEAPFESIFFAGNVHLKDQHKWKEYFDLVIGNPPYGPFSGKYSGMGEKTWTGATQYDQYFMLRNLDLLKPRGLLIFLIPSSFLDNDDKYVDVQKKIDEKAELVDAYRLPNKIFPNTDWGTDIIVLRKK